MRVKMESKKGKSAVCWIYQYSKKSLWLVILLALISGAIAIEAGVSRVHILDGRIPHCLLLEIFTNKGIGTAILNSTESRYNHDEQ